jgi:hypothetical protein
LDRRVRASTTLELGLVQSAQLGFELGVLSRQLADLAIPLVELID